MTDPNIEEIYVLAEAALTAGQPSIPVHAFPFRMNAERVSKKTTSPWYGFWSNLKTGHDVFERDRVPPIVMVVEGAYVFEKG